jgi:hypothetical protein
LRIPYKHHLHAVGILLGYLLLYIRIIVISILSAKHHPTPFLQYEQKPFNMDYASIVLDWYDQISMYFMVDQALELLDILLLTL